MFLIELNFPTQIENIFVSTFMNSRKSLKRGKIEVKINLFFYCCYNLGYDSTKIFLVWVGNLDFKTVQKKEPTWGAVSPQNLPRDGAEELLPA